MPRSSRSICRGRLTAGLIALSVGMAGCPAPGAITPADLPGRGGKTLLAIYMIGSDLEDDIKPRNRIPDEIEHGRLVNDGHGTRDLLELLEGYRSLPFWQRSNVDVLVAFGGARKQGWRGVTYADVDTLLEDAKDGYFGNLDGQYLYQDRQANMGDASTFQQFLDKVRQRSETASVTMTSLWNHGASYGGLGPDTNHGGRGYLHLEAMSRAYGASGFRPDLIGFDACLMASAEVLQALHPHADYLVASEELEPGHGWDYTPIIRYLGQNAGPHPLSVGRAIVDAFITSPRHQATSGKTLSVIDLRQAGPLLQGIDLLAQGLQGDIATAYMPMLVATGQSGRFGKSRTGQGSREHSVDLAEFAQQLKARLPQVAGAADQVAHAVQNAVVYNRTDGTVSHANGVSILSFNNPTADLQRSYGEDRAATAGWYELVTRFTAHGQADETDPVIIEEGPIVRHGVNGMLLTIRDDKALSEVAAIHAVMDPTERYLRFLAYEPLDTSPGGKDQFFLPDWDGRALHVADGALTAATAMPIMVEMEPGPHGSLQYTAMAILNGRDVAVTLQWDEAKQQVVRVWAAGYTMTEDGEVSFDRQQSAIGVGDELQFYEMLLDLEGGGMDMSPGPAIRFSQAPTWGKLQATGAKSYFVFAEDANANSAVSTPQFVAD